MTQTIKQLVIYGSTLDGKRFRPSDWTERLAGVMSQFRPQGSASDHISYSPYVIPRVINDTRCVVVDYRLRELEPLAWHFVCNFASDNQLKTEEIIITDSTDNKINKNTENYVDSNNEKSQ